MEMYTSLAEWWPLISPLEDYAEEAAFVAGLLRDVGARDVLELGSGGGHMAAYLKRVAPMTLIDIAPEMLAVSEVLNPECTHVVGDMRTVRLRQEFDAVFVHDAVMYMTTEADLAAAMTTAFVHCRPGGTVIFEPDCTTETFAPGSDEGGSDAPDGRGARYVEWSWDPDPTDNEARTDYAFLLRESDGSVRAVYDSHRWGLFPRETWLRLLGGAGFAVTTVTEETTEDRPARELFIATRPTTA